MTGSRDVVALATRGRRLADDFLSMDIEALVRKLPSQSFRSPHHWPVEIVRSALARGASRVEIRVGRRRVEVYDDGAPLEANVLDDLRTVFDPSKGTRERHEALERFEAEVGLGILAAFSPGPGHVSLETGSTAIEFRAGRTPTVTPASCSGTRIVVHGGRRDPGRERRAIVEHCRAARASLMLDGMAIHGAAVPRDAIASARLDLPDLQGWIWVPREGDVSEILFTNHGILADRLVVDPIGGFVWMASLETRSRDVPPSLDGEIHRLYRRMVSTWRLRSEVTRDRIEDLVYRVWRRAPEMDVVKRFSPFEVLGSSERLNLEAVQSLASAGPVRSISKGEDPSRHGGSATPILLLTARQRRFLAEDLKLTLARPIPSPSGPTAWERIVSRARGLARRLREGWLSLVVDPVPGSAMTEAEAALVRVLGETLARRGSRDTLVVLSRGRGPDAGALVRRGDRKILAVFRDHPYTGHAMRAIANDPTNAAFVLEGYAPGVSE